MISMKRLAGGVALSALACAMSTAVYAQETTSAIRGQLTGESGAPVANATVTILHTPSGTRSVTASGADGVFDARGLRVGGPYTVTVAAPGFETKTLSGLNLGLGDTQRLNFDLVAENAVEELVVTAALDPESNNTGVSQTLDRDSIQSVVSVSRDIRDVARRNLLASNNPSADGGISIAGSNPKQNRVTIDGAAVQDDFGLNAGGFPTLRGPISLDAVEQITVQSVPYDVQNGDFQGGSIDMVLRSGTNDFHGTLFTNYLNDGMVGDAIKNTSIKQAISQSNYGGFLGGPLWKDKLFFAVSYEKYETASPINFGPVGAGFPNTITNLTQATIDRVVNILNNTYTTEFDAGGIARTTPILDEKYTGKIDWNINDNHRASFTYRYALSELTSPTNLSTGQAGLSSNWYLTGEEDYTYVGELNSKWTDNLSTQIRVSYRDYERRQNPPGGQEFAELQICTNEVSAGVLTTCETGFATVRIGPDEFRQANELETHNLQFQAKAEYSLGDHLFKVGVESQNLEIVNLFVSRSDGVYYFDSITDFQNGRANQLAYSNAPSGNPNDAAAVFEYQQNSVFFQDTLDVTEDLQVTAGVRYDWYKSDDKPILNPNFLARNGINNQTTYDGLSLLMPRFAFNYKPAGKPYRVNGGFGLFSGGVPDVLISTSFSTTGYAASGVTIRRTATGFEETNRTPTFTQAIGAAALNVNVADPRFGYDLPGAVTGLVTPSSIPPNGEVIALDPNFKMPSSWKFFLSGSVDLPWDMTLTADYVATYINSTIAYRDLRARPLVVNGVTQYTPDGRLRYDGLSSYTDAQRAAAGIAGPAVAADRDLIVTNTDQGKGYVFGIGLAKDFDFGLSTSIGYAHQELDEQTAGLRFGTTGGSLYASQAADAFDPNRDAYGRGYEEVTDRVKFELSYRKEFIPDHATRFTLFAESRSGRPTTATMGSAGGGRSTIFGVNRSAFLLYVPDIAADTNPTDNRIGNVVFNSNTTRDAFLAAVKRFDLGPGTVEKGSIQNPDINQVDLQFSQELPSLVKGHKFRLVFDVQNVLNLLNKDWGTVEEYSGTGSGQGNHRIVDVACGDAAGNPVTALNPAACNTYIYSNPSATALQRTVNTNRSLWYVQVGLRYEF